jgi:hypothetical protein
MEMVGLLRQREREKQRQRQRDREREFIGRQPNMNTRVGKSGRRGIPDFSGWKLRAGGNSKRPGISSES